MTHEKRYEEICRMLEAYDNVQGYHWSAEILENPYNWQHSVIPFYGEAARLIIEAREGMDKENGRNAATMSTLKKMIKGVQEYQRDTMGGLFQIEDETGTTRYVFLDGYRMVRLNEDVPSLPHIKEGRHPAPDELNRRMVHSYLEELDTPQISKVKEAVAEAKAKGKARRGYNIHFQLSNGQHVNAVYLIDALKLFPDMKFYATSNDLLSSPIIGKASAGDALIMPLKIS